MFVTGKSGNPSGRPKGIQDKRTALRDLLSPHAPDLVAKAVELAMQGDTTLRLCIDRLIPPLKAQATQTQLDVTGSLSERGEAILKAITEGKLDSATGNSMIGALATQAKLLEITAIEERLTALEERNGLRHTSRISP